MGQAAVFNFFRIFRKKQKEILLVLTISKYYSKQRTQQKQQMIDRDQVRVQLTFNNVKINTNA
jgi:hypothetical protein